MLYSLLSYYRLILSLRGLDSKSLHQPKKQKGENSAAEQATSTTNSNSRDGSSVQEWIEYLDQSLRQLRSDYSLLYTDYRMEDAKHEIISKEIKVLEYNIDNSMKAMKTELDNSIQTMRAELDSALKSMTKELDRALEEKRAEIKAIKEAIAIAGRTLLATSVSKSVL